MIFRLIVETYVPVPPKSSSIVTLTGELFFGNFTVLDIIKTETDLSKRSLFRRLDELLDIRLTVLRPSDQPSSLVLLTPTRQSQKVYI